MNNFDQPNIDKNVNSCFALGKTLGGFNGQIINCNNNTKNGKDVNFWVRKSA